MKSTPSPRFSLANKSKRLALLTLVSLVAVAALLSFAVSANRANRAAKARAEFAGNTKSAINPTVQNDKQPNAPAAAIIVGTLTDNVAAATKVAPGGTINYTATITNNGAASPADDAINLNFSAPLDANTTLVAGSVHASPLAFDDTYNWVGNTQLDTVARALPAVTANDIAVNAPAGTDTFTVTAIAGGAPNTALGGVVTLASPSGSFVYTPPLGRPNIADGATVQDSFTYTITNNADPTLTATGTVRINLTGRVWYLVAGGVGDGRSNTPSGSPSLMSTAADKFSPNPSPDIFYIFSNAGSLNGLFTVKAGQQLLGQGVNLVVNAITLFNAAAPTPTTTNTAGNCVALAGAPGNNTLSGFNIGTCTGGTAITGANVGTLNVSTMSITTNGGALDLTGVGAPTVSVVLGGTTSTGGAKNVNLVGLNGTFTLANGALSGATGNGFDVNGGTATITYLGTISNSGAKQANIANKTGGSVTFDGAVSGTGSGINLATNTGATITFRGGVVLSTGANTAFNATGGGTINVCDENPCVPGAVGALVNSLTTGTGTALNVSGTTIGGNNLEFRSISSNGAANGIVLNNTGAGFLRVAGNGGTCNSVASCTGGAIQNSTNAAISLTSTTSPSFTRIAIQNAARSGIDGQQVTNFTLANSFIDNVGTGAAGQHEESNIAFNDGGVFTNTNLSGTVSITNCILTNARRHGIQIENGNGTISNLTITGNTLTSSTNAAVSLGSGILVLQQGSAGTTSHLTTGTISSNTVTNFPSSEGIAILGGTGNSTNNTSATLGANGTPINITNNTISGQAAAASHMGSNAIRASMNSQFGVMNFNISCNGKTTGGCTATGPITNIQGQGISVFAGGTITGAVTVDNNVIVANQTLGAGTQGLAVQLDDGPAAAGTSDPDMNITITNNNVSAYEGNGIRAIARATNRATMDLTIQNNTVGTPILANRNGIRVDSGSAAGDTNVCLLMTGNTSAGSGVNQGIGIRKQGTNAAVNVFGIIGLVPSPTTGANAAAKLVANNPAGGGVDVLSGDNFVSCAQTAIPDPAGSATSNRAVDTNMATSFAQPVNETIVTNSTLPVVTGQPLAKLANAGVSAWSGKQVAVVQPKTNSGEVLSHHPVRKNAFSQDPNAPTAGEIVTLTPIATFPAGGKSITIKYSATVNVPPLAKQVSTQGTVSGGNFASVLTDDPEPAGAANPTVTLVDTLMTWNGATSTDWNTASNWTQPAGGTQYAPGVSNPAINDVVIPNVGAQPNISTTDIGVFSLNISNGRTLTITNPRVLTIGGSPGGDLTLDGIISGGFLNLGTGTHAISNAGGTGSLSPTNVATVLSGSTTTLNNNLQAGALAVNAGGSMNITNRTLSLNGAGAALTVGGTLTTTGSTVILNGSAAQTIAGIAYNNLTINNTIGLTLTGVTLTGNASVNGVLALTSSDLDTGTFTLTQPNTTASTGVSDVVGTVSRTGGPFALATPLTFGNPNNVITFTAGTAPTSILVNMVKAVPSGAMGFPTAVQRTYTITPTGGSGIAATLRLHYLDPELNGNIEGPDFIFRRFNGTGWAPVLPTSSDFVNNWLEATGVAQFSAWTFNSTFAPTASSGVVTGRIVDANGTPVEGAVVRLAGTQNRKFITDANGFYRFDNVETNGFYTVTPSRANYEFNPAVRSFSQIGETTEATFGATLTSGSNFINPLDTPEYFVRQHYLDFLGREPDEAGFNFWSDQILECGSDTQCVERRRENVSAAYFLSIEFQETGGLVDGLYRASYGVRPEFAQFIPDTRAVAQGVVVGQEGWEAKLDANKEAFVAAFVNRPTFVGVYGNMDNSLFVDTLISHTGVSFTSAERDALVAGLTTGAMTRADALQSIAENQRFVRAKFNDAFVMMEYFGYLRRDADASGFAFWLNKLNEFGGNFEQAEMVKAFIVSSEYRGRFPR